MSTFTSWLIKQARRRIGPSPVESLAMGIGRGLLAGVAGTAAISLSQAIEMKLTKREPSTAPADAAGKVLGIRPRHLAGKARFAHIVHWAYGTTWGLFRAALGGRPRRRLWAALAQLAAIQTAALVMLPKLGVAPPLTEWEPAEIGTEILHHAVYSIAADATYRSLA